MEQTIQKLNDLIGVISTKLPDENDLKGFPGISKALILDSLNISNGLLTTLKGHNNHFEVILFKRESADVFEKLFRELDEDFDKIKTDKFNTILKQISKLNSLSRQTYATVINSSPLRSEAEIAKLKEELALLTSNNEQLKQINQDLLTLKDSTIKNASAVTNEASAFRDNAKTIKDVIEGMKTTSETIIADFKEKQRVAIENENQITAFLGTIEETKASVEKIKENTTQWQSDIKAAKENLETKTEEFDKLNTRSKNIQKEIEETHEKIFGKTDEDNKLIKGYLQETEDLKNSLAKFLKEQEDKFLAQFTEIKGLLPDATSAGLAAAYQKQKESYTQPILLWSIVFFSSILGMTVVGVIILIMHFKNAIDTSLNGAFISLLKDLPFFIPTIWLAAFASKQQSQYKRLQQEYAFKETNAKSFHGHKEQIERLMKDGAADKELIAQLVAQLVMITAQNPSYTLDNKSHEDSSPLLKVFEKYLPWSGGKKDKA
ncbi:MAG: hypothetical protein HYZ15_05470 [Sphingobacteriales bacterium]|nr:hypothetical protein [Sphingobacteriales bacterium]